MNEILFDIYSIFEISEQKKKHNKEKKFNLGDKNYFTYNRKRILNTILNEIQEVVIAQYFFFISY